MDGFDAVGAKQKGHGEGGYWGIEGLFIDSMLITKVSRMVIIQSVCCSIGIEYILSQQLSWDQTSNY